MANDISLLIEQFIIEAYIISDLNSNELPNWKKLQILLFDRMFWLSVVIEVCPGDMTIITHHQS